MSENRGLLREKIEEGETQNGSVEFKYSLSRNIHLSDNKRNSLVAQMKHRVLSGDGEATYVVGVKDNGEIEGLEKLDFEETLDILSLIADEADLHINDVNTFETDNGRIVALVTVGDTEAYSSQSNHIIVGTAGHVDHGKSTLVGSLVSGSEDDGEGGTRGYMDVKPHEIERGLSADLSYAVYGFSDGEPQRLRNPTKSEEKSQVVESSDRVVSFVDTVGHQPWLRTAIRGLVGQKLDYGLLAISADGGVTKTTREHLGVLLAMELPTIIAITKTDLVGSKRIDEVEKEVEGLLRESGVSPLPHSHYDLDTIVDETKSNVVPIVRTSAVEMKGLDVLDELFRRLPVVRENTTEEDFSMYIDKTYTVEGVGTVVSGTVRSGVIEKGDELLLGPKPDGSFINTKARSIEIHYHRVDEAEAGQLVSVAVRNVDPDDVRRGMILVKDGSSPQPTREFEANVMVLNHPTKITDGYEPVVHLETASETTQIFPDDSSLLPGEKGKARFKFKFNPYVIEEGQRFVFREGQSKGVGTVTDINLD